MFLGKMVYNLSYPANNSLPTNAFVSWNWGDGTSVVEPLVFSGVVYQLSRVYKYTKDGNYITNVTIFNNVSSQDFLINVSLVANHCINISLNYILPSSET